MRNAKEDGVESLDYFQQKANSFLNLSNGRLSLTKTNIVHQINFTNISLQWKLKRMEARIVLILLKLVLS